MAREVHDGPAVEVIDASDLKPCPPLPGPWPERITAVCTCCGDRMEAFIDQRATAAEDDGGNAYVIPYESHPKLLAMSASCVGLDGVGGWLCIPDSKRGVSWVCRSCVQVAIDFDSEEVQKALAMWLRWTRIEVEDRSRSVEPHRRGWGRR